MLNKVLKKEFLEELNDSKLNIIYSNTYQDGGEVLIEILNSNLSYKEDNLDKYNIFLVPSNFTLAIENLVCQKLGIGSYFNLEFLHLNEFIKKLIKNENREYLTKESSIILVSNIIRKFRNKNYSKTLSFYKKITENSMNKILEIKNIIYRFRSMGLNSKNIKNLQNYSNKNDIFFKKIEDISNIYEEYENEIEKKYLDDFSLIEILKNMISKREIDLSSHNFYITEVTEMSKQEIELYKLIIDNAKSFNIVIPKEKNEIKNEIYINKEELTDFEKDYRDIYPNDLYQTFKDIKNKIPNNQVKEIYYYKKEKKFQEFIRANLFSYNDKKCNDNRTLNIYSAKNKEEEVEFLAIDIKKKIVEEGYNFSDFNIAVTDIEEYKNLIEITFERYNIPIFLNNNIKLYQSKIFNYIKHIIQLNIRPLHENYYALLYNPYFLCSLNSQEDKIRLKNSFEVFLKKYKIDIERLSNETIENIFSFKNLAGEFIEKELLKDDVLYVFHEFEAFKKIFKSSKSTKEQIEKIKKIIENKELNDFLMLKYLKNRDSLEYEIIKTAEDKLIELLNTIALIYKDEKLSLETLFEFLNFASKDISLNDVPLFVNTVYCGDLYNSMFTKKDNLYIIGSNSELMPKISSDNLVIKKTDFMDQIDSLILENKQENKKTIDIYRELIKDNNKSKFKIIQTITKSNINLCLTYSILSGQNTNSESNVLIELNNMFFDRKNSIKEININEDKYIGYVCKEQNKNQEKNSDTSLNVSNIIEELLKDKNGINVTNVTMVNTHKNCSLRCFVNNILKIKDNLNFETTVIDLGNISHQVIEEVLKDEEIRKILVNSNKIKKEEKEKIDKKIDFIFKSAILEKQKRNKEEEIQFEILNDQIRESVNLVINDIKNSYFKPNNFEFSPNKIMLENNDVRFIVNGKVDRIDQFNNLYKVLDYKSSDSNFSNIKENTIDVSADLLQHSVYSKLLEKDNDFKNKKLSHLEYYNLDNRIKGNKKIRRYIAVNNDNFFNEIKNIDNLFNELNISDFYESCPPKNYKRKENVANKYIDVDKNITLEISNSNDFKKVRLKNFYQKKLENKYNINNLWINVIQIQIKNNENNIYKFYKIKVSKNDDEEKFIIEGVNLKEIIEQNFNDFVGEFIKIKEGDITACEKDNCEICSKKI